MYHLTAVCNAGTPRDLAGNAPGAREEAHSCPAAPPAPADSATALDAAGLSAVRADERRGTDRALPCGAVAVDMRGDLTSELGYKPQDDDLPLDVSAGKQNDPLGDTTSSVTGLDGTIGPEHEDPFESACF